MQYTTSAANHFRDIRLFYQDFKDTFVCNTQHGVIHRERSRRCFIRISKILLYAIHNARGSCMSRLGVVLSGFQRYFCMQYTTRSFVSITTSCCFIRISKILLYAIHNSTRKNTGLITVVLSGFQRYFCMQYTTTSSCNGNAHLLFYQDFKDTFVCNTQHRTCATCKLASCFIRISKILLYAIHNGWNERKCAELLFYQDFKDTFVCNTQLSTTTKATL